MEESQQEVQSNPGWRPWRTYSRGASRRWPFKYVQSYDCIIMPIEENCHELFVAYYLCLIIVIHVRRLDLQYWSMFIFRRLKINHDSHEFILEFGTVANINLCKSTVASKNTDVSWRNCGHFFSFQGTVSPVTSLEWAKCSIARQALVKASGAILTIFSCPYYFLQAFCQICRFYHEWG